MQELSMTPDSHEILDGFDASCREIMRQLREFCQLRHTVKLLKRAPIVKNGIFRRDSYVEHNELWQSEGWNLWLMRWQQLSKEKYYVPGFISVFRLFKDSECKTCMVMLCNAALTCQTLLPPSIFSTHFLSRYRERQLRRSKLSIEEVASCFARWEAGNADVIRTPLPYGTSERKTKIVRRLKHGVAFGYFDYDRQVYYYDTYVTDDMLWVNQRYMHQDVFDAFFRELGDMTQGTVMTKIENDSIRKLTDAEIEEYNRIKDTPEWEEKHREEVLRLFRENQQRWERKSMRSADSVQVKRPQYLPKAKAREYDRVFE